MPFWQLDLAFLYKELKELVSLGHIKVICALGLLDPSLVHCKWLFSPTPSQLRLSPPHHQLLPLDQLF
jgi:hypothetical protein